MRWLWIDRFLSFESGRRAVAVKAVSLGEEHIDGYLPGFPVMAGSLMIEGIAQTGGLLVSEHGQFRDRIVLAKIGRANFHGQARPGDLLTLSATVQDIRQDGSMVEGTIHRDGELIAEVDLVFAHLDDRFEGIEQFEPADFLALLRTFGMFDVGVAADGSPLVPPPHLLEAERLANHQAFQESNA